MLVYTGIGTRRAPTQRVVEMDIPREDSGKKRLIRRTLTGSVVVAALLGITAGVYRLQPAAPPFEYATAWHDTVKRGPMVREVHGTGSLVPEDAMLITASSDGRVERILIRPGTPVKADSVVMILTSPELETQLLDAEYALKAAEADLANLKVTLEKAKLDIQSTVAQVGADFNIAKLQADRDEALAKEGLFPHIDAKISAVKAQQLSSRYQLEQKRLSINADAEEAQLAAQKVKVEQLRGQYNLKKSLVDQLKVRAGFSGMLGTSATFDPRGRGPEGGHRHSVGQGCPARKAEGRIEDRRNTSKGCHDRAAGGHRHA